MKKEYIKPTIISRNVRLQNYMHTVSGARTTTGLNNSKAGWKEIEIGVNNDDVSEIWGGSAGEFTN